MIKIENSVFPSDAQWETVVRGIRNPYASWHKSDSSWKQSYDFVDNDHQIVREKNYFEIGEADLELMQKLAKAGDDHGKFLRMLPVMCDITAPVFFDAELDTYKIGTVRNSCSLQHNAMSKPYTIRDFSVDERIVEILDPIKVKKEYPLIYPAEQDNEYKEYFAGRRRYFIYKSGRIVADAYDCVHESDNRVRHFEMRECHPSQTPFGYYQLNIGSHKDKERWQLHRLVAWVWHKDTYFDGACVNHKDGNKGNNSADNLEWVTHRENDIHKVKNGLSGHTIRTQYLIWKATSKTTPYERTIIREEYKSKTATIQQLADKYGLHRSGVEYIVYEKHCENDEIFSTAYTWEKLLDQLNSLREAYLDTKDEKYFFDLRQIMPMGYNYRFSWSANYQVLKRIYHARKDHKLKEWHDFCSWIREEVPFAKEIIICEGDGD